VIAGITGGTGFVGRRLVAMALARGDRVRVLARGRDAARALPAGAELWEGDLAGPAEPLRRFANGLDVSYHCAGETRLEARMQDVNLQGTRNLLRAAAGGIRRWIQLSSVGAYGKQRDGEIGEGHPLRPEGAYEVSKTEAEGEVMAQANGHGFECCVLRPSKVIGVGMRDRSLYSLFDLLARGRFFFIGKPGAILYYVHVDDVACAPLACGSHGAAADRLYNVARQISVEDFAAAACSAIGCRPPSLRLPEAPIRIAAALTAWLPGNPLTSGRIDGLTSRLVYSSEAIGRDLGFRFSHSIESGLRELAEDWRRSC
jgi:nucleoside-diphosphate-sugar epimerase